MASSVQQSPQAGNGHGHYVASSDGRYIKIPRELYDAFLDYLSSPTCPSGSIKIHCKNGGVASVTCERVYK